MKRAAWFCGWLLWAVGAHAAPSSGLKDCSLKQLVSIPLSLQDEGVYVPVTLNARQAWLALMTDVSSSSIRQGAVPDLQLPIEKSRSKEGYYMEMGGKLVTQVATIERPLIGDLPLPLKVWPIVPETAEAKSLNGLPIAGMLAMDILWHFDFELDLLQRKLILFSKDHCPGQGAYWAKSYGKIPMEVAEFGNMYIAVNVDGKKIEASFATSQSISVMSATVARRVFGITETVADTEPDSNGQVLLTKFFRPTSVSLGDLTIPEVSLGLMPPPLATEITHCTLSSRGRPSGAIGFNGCYGLYPLEIGVREMAKLRLYFAMGERVIYFTYAEDSNKEGGSTLALATARH
jgi:hypothetical protein